MDFFEHLSGMADQVRGKDTRMTDAEKLAVAAECVKDLIGVIEEYLMSDAPAYGELEAAMFDAKNLLAFDWKR